MPPDFNVPLVHKEQDACQSRAASRADETTAGITSIGGSRGVRYGIATLIDNQVVKITVHCSFCRTETSHSNIAARARDAFRKQATAISQ